MADNNSTTTETPNNREYAAQQTTTAPDSGQDIPQDTGDLVDELNEISNQGCRHDDLPELPREVDDYLDDETDPDRVVDLVNTLAEQTSDERTSLLTNTSLSPMEADVAVLVGRHWVREDTAAMVFFACSAKPVHCFEAEKFCCSDVRDVVCQVRSKIAVAKETVERTPHF